MNSLKAKIVLITGSNKGIGFGIARGLLQKQTPYKTIITSRDEERGLEALKQLASEFEEKKDNLFYHQLDICDHKSIDNCIKWIKETFNQIDILVNNAGVAVRGDDFDTKVFDYTFATNVYGTIDFTEKCLSNDVIASNGKIIIVGSKAGLLKYFSDESVKDEFRDKDITLDKLYDLASRFRKSIENDTVEIDGFRRSVYGVSKAIINSYPKVLAKRNDVIEKNIQVNSLCPGYVRTDMTNPKASLSVEEGVLTPLYLVEVENNPKNQAKFFHEQKVFDWEA
jgi:NAD(P)-dependent dehydrogenase (short-subunit alcohol dehydrogenase family)